MIVKKLHTEGLSLFNSLIEWLIRSSKAVWISTIAGVNSTCNSTTSG